MSFDGDGEVDIQGAEEGGRGEVGGSGLVFLIHFLSSFYNSFYLGF